MGLSDISKPKTVTEAQAEKNRKAGILKAARSGKWTEKRKGHKKSYQEIHDTVKASAKKDKGPKRAKGPWGIRHIKEAGKYYFGSPGIPAEKDRQRKIKEALPGAK